MNKKTYTYTNEIEIDFEAIANNTGLSKKTPSLLECKDIINDYIAGLDDCDYYIIDNEDEIAKDLYTYLRNRNEEKPMEQDIYTITPKIEAELTHAMALLDDYLGDAEIAAMAGEEADIDKRVAEAFAILQELPFFKKSY